MREKVLCVHWNFLFGFCFIERNGGRTSDDDKCVDYFVKVCIWMQKNHSNDHKSKEFLEPIK